MRPKALVGIIAFLLAIGTFVVSFMMNAENPKVVLVYTQKEPIPDIIFKVSSISLALASYVKFGDLRFSIQPATTQNLETALATAEFLVIGTHGWDGRLYSDDKDWIGPSKIQNHKMRSIYFGSCYFGAKRSDWEKMFPNAEIIGYDFETYPLTGWFYLVFKSWIDLSKLNFAQQ